VFGGGWGVCWLVFVLVGGGWGGGVFVFFFFFFWVGGGGFVGGGLAFRAWPATPKPPPPPPHQTPPKLEPVQIESRLTEDLDLFFELRIADICGPFLFDVVVGVATYASGTGMTTLEVFGTMERLRIGLGGETLNN